MKEKGKSPGKGREIMIALNPNLSKEFWANHQVHHIDHNPLNNEIDNLLVLERFHHRLLHRKYTGNEISASCRLDKETHKQLRHLCIDQGINLQDLIKRLLLEWIEEQKGVGK